MFLKFITKEQSIIFLFVSTLYSNLGCIHNNIQHFFMLPLGYEYENEYFIASWTDMAGAKQETDHKQNKALSEQHYPPGREIAGVWSFLAHLPLDKMAAICQTKFSDAFSWMESLYFD